MKKKETRYNELPINFDDSIYQSKGSLKEKSDYIFSLLSTFFNQFDNFPILLTSQAIPSFQKIFDILPSSFEFQNSQNLLLIIPKFLLCFKPYYTEIPHAELYISIYDSVITEYAKYPNSIYIETLEILFHSRNFCKNFLSASRLNNLLQMKMEDIVNFEKVLLIINSTSLFDEIKELKDYKQFIINTYNFASDQYTKNNFSDQYFVIFLHFILNIIIRLYNFSRVDIDSDIETEKIFEELLFSSGIFDKINNFLIYLDDGEVTWSILHPLMTCSADPTEMPYDLKIFLQLNKIFINHNFSLKSKQTILLELLHDDVVYESPFCINQTQFPIHLWLTEEVVCDEELFSIYIKIIEKCISMDKSSVHYSIHKFIELTSPPIQKNSILYEKIFEWLSKIVNPNNFSDMQPIDSSIFNDDFFYDSLFLNPPLEVVDQYFEFQYYYQLFCLLFDSRRTKYHRKDIIPRIFDLIQLNHNKYLHRYKIDQMLLANFEVNILNYCIDNISDEKVLNVFNKMNSDSFIRFPQLFRAGTTFSIIEKHLKEDDTHTIENYMCEILLLIHSIVNSSKDMFFDEWVLTLPKESPLFKLKGEIIAPFICSTSVIFLPSLVPLLPNFDFNSYSPYNHYLLGRYSVPVALKLGIELANMSQICSHYISFDTYHYLMKTGKIINLVKRSKTREEIQCYEFFLGSLPGSITLPTQQSIENETKLIFNSPDSDPSTNSQAPNLNEELNYACVMFYVKFNSVPTNPFPFLHVSKNTFYVNDDYIAYGDKAKKKIKQIYSNVWYLIRVQKTKIMNWTEFYIDNKKELTIHEAFHFEMIGDDLTQVTTSFFVAQNIFATTFVPESNIINRFNLHYQRSVNPILHGGVVSAPIYSISNLLRENFTFLHNFDEFDDILFKSKQKRIENESINDFFVFLIQTADYLADNQLFMFYERFLLSFLMNPSYFNQFHIVGLIQSILMLKNIQTRTTVFISTLFNIELWHKLDIDLLIYLVQYINTNEAAKFDWKMIFTKQNFLYSIHLICYANSIYKPQNEASSDSISEPHLRISDERKNSFDFDHCSSYTPLFKEFFDFWENASKILLLSNEPITPILKELSELSCIPDMASMNANVEMNQFNVTEVLTNSLNQKDETDCDLYDIRVAIRVKTVLFIQKLERNTRQSQIFSNGMLLYFSYFMPVQAAQALFLSLIQVRCNESNSYIVENLPIVSKISQRFCDSSLIWSLFVSQLTGESSFQIDLDNPITKIEIPKKIECPQIFSILIELLIALFAKKNVVYVDNSSSASDDTSKSEQSSFINEQMTNLKKENALKLMVELFNINDPVVLLEDANLPAFIHLVSGGKYKDKKGNNNVLKVSNYSLNIDLLDLPNKLSINEMKALETKIIENKDLFMKLIEKYSFQPVANLSSDIGLFITTILVKMFISLTEKKSNRIQFYFSLLSDLADDKILRHTLINIFLYISGRQNSASTVNLLITVISNLLIKRKNMFNLKLFNAIIDFSTSFNAHYHNNQQQQQQANEQQNEQNNETNEKEINFISANNSGAIDIEINPTGRKDSFGNSSDLNNSTDYLKMMAPLFILCLNEIGKVDASKTTFTKLAKIFLDNAKLLLEEYQTISIILIYIFIKYKTEDFSKGEISIFYQQLKEHYIVTPDTPKFWEVIDLTPTYSSLLVTVYFKLTSSVSPLASPTPSTNIELNETTNENENEVKDADKNEANSNMLLSEASPASSTYDFTSTSNMNDILSSISSSESTSNFIFLVHESLVQFESFFANWRSSYFEHSYLDLSFRDLPLDQCQTVANNIAYYVTRETMMYFYENRQYYVKLNARMRFIEKWFSFFISRSITNKSQLGKLQCRSFRASSFAAPAVCPVVCMPSAFSIKTPECKPADLMKSKSLPLEQQPGIINQSNNDLNCSPIAGSANEALDASQDSADRITLQQSHQQISPQQEQVKEDQKELEKPSNENQDHQEKSNEEQQKQAQETAAQQEQPAQQEPKEQEQEAATQQEQPTQQEPKEQAQETATQQEQAKEAPEQQESKEQTQDQQIQDEPKQQANEEPAQQEQEKSASADQAQQEVAEDHQDTKPHQEESPQTEQEKQNQQPQPQEQTEKEPQAQQHQEQNEPQKQQQQQTEKVVKSEKKAHFLQEPQSNQPANSSPIIPTCQQQESQYLSSLDLLGKPDESQPINAKIDFDCSYQIHHFFSTVVCHSTLINVGSIYLFDLFKELFGEVSQYHPCTLIRQDFRIESICFNMMEPNRCLILTDATSSKECKIKLLDQTPHLSESFLMNEFGPYSMFCGHYIMVIDLQSIVMSSKFTSRLKESSLLIDSVSNGSFILEFLFFSIIQPSFVNLNIKGPQKLWLDNIISTKDYLEIINFYGMRSFDDFCAYPIFPRVIQDLNKFVLEDHSHEQNDAKNTEIELAVSNVRDLSKPIQIIGYDDTQTFVRSFQSNHFHYFENISNPITVSSLNLRLAPFCYQQWYLNDGWDKGERNFTSAALRLSITKKTIDELPPEMFCYPEILMNKNKFRLPSGKLFNVQFPEWCNCGHCSHCKEYGKNGGFSGCKKAPFYFIEFMRYVLEHSDVRKNLNKWIDLNFGDKLMSEEDLTVYHPLSFVSSSQSESGTDLTQTAKNIEKQRDWMLQCGQVPRKVFDSPHPQFDENKQLYPSDFNPLNFTFVPKEFPFMKNLNKFTMNRANSTSLGFAFYPPYVYSASIAKDTVVNIRNNIEFVTNIKGNIIRRVVDIYPSLFFKRHVEIGTDFIVVTYSLSLISVYKIIKNDQGFFVKPIGSLVCTCFKKRDSSTPNVNKNGADVEDDIYYQHSFNGDGDVIEDNGIVDFNDDADDSYYESKALYSTLHAKQFICATVCTSEVIIWCFSTSMIVARIDVEANLDDGSQKVEVLTARFDEEINVLYLAMSNGELHQYSLNGQLIRKINLKVGISAIHIVPSGFSVFSRFIVTGHTDGSVRILRVDLKTREFVIVKEKNLFQLQIDKIVSHRDSYAIDVYVIPSRLI